MIDPFDTEFLSQELRDSWKRIEELEVENNMLRNRIMELEKDIEYQTEQDELDYERWIRDREEGWGD